MYNRIPSNDPSRSELTRSNNMNPYVEYATKIGGKSRKKRDPAIENEAACKIQNTFRCYLNKKYFRTVQKPQLERESEDFIRRQLNLCERKGRTLSTNDYSLNGWKRFYPSNERFFNEFDKNQKEGYVLQTTKVENPDDPNRVTVYQGDADLFNNKHGFGTLTTTEDVKIGTWRDDRFTGWGIDALRGGHVTEAKYIDGIANGKGIMKNTKGDVYTGDFENDKRHGRGELDARTFNYNGDFYNNKMQGYGKIYFKNNHEEYEGEFKNNQICGQGTFRWPNGDVYQGEMVNGKRSGNGKYIYANKQVYEGRYEDGAKSGRGKVTFNDGKSYNANFINGRPEGEGELVKNGEKMDVYFQGGRASKIGGSVA